MAVTVTYEFPVAGTVAPTAAQSFRRNTVIANIIKTADADASAVITHNFNLSAAELAAGGPEVVLTPINALFFTTIPFVDIAAADANTVTITLGTAVGSGNAAAQILAFVKRPASVTQ